MSRIILISGATGVGTTSVASGMAKKKGILYLVGIDAIREAARQLIKEPINQSLHRSSYLAGKSANYGSKSEDVRKEKIVRGFKTQGSAVKVCVDGIINRYLRENTQTILEGVNLVPGDYNKLITSGNATQILIDLEKEEIHLARLRNRAITNPARGNAYLDNFREIRYVRDYLVRKARENNIKIVDNSGNLEDTINRCLSFIH